MNVKHTNAFDIDPKKNDELHQRLQNLLTDRVKQIPDVSAFETIMTALKYRGMEHVIIEHSTFTEYV